MTTPSMRPRFMSVGQLARRVGVTDRTVERWCDRGLIPCQRTPGNHRRIRREDADAFIARHAQPVAEAS